MKRYAVVRQFMTKLLHESDAAIFTGKELCKEAYQYDRPGNFYIQDHFGVSLSFALGVAMSTNKRVFLFVGEGDLIRELSAPAQMAISKCKTIFMVVLNNESYQTAGGHPTMFERITSPDGVFFSFGMFIHNYTKFFETRQANKIKNFFKDIVGPLTVFVKVDKGVKRGLPEIDLDDIKMKIRFITFIRDEKIGSALRTVAVPVLTLKDEADGGTD